MDPPPRPPLQPPRTSATCHRHPDELFAGSFCPLCLCERLATLDIPPLSPAPQSSTKTPASAIKSIFKPAAPAVRSFFPELRRAKSFSASKGEGFSAVFEPQRHSCDVRGRGNLWTLFAQEDDKKTTSIKKESHAVGAAAAAASSSSHVFEDEIQAAVEATNVRNSTSGEIVEEDFVAVAAAAEEEMVNLQVSDEREMEVKTIKDHMDLDSNQFGKPPGGARDLKEIAGSFWTAASVFSKKLHKWRGKQKTKKRNNKSGSATLPVEKPIGRQFRETQSEVADYGFGRRSCSTDPRFSLDIGRISLDDTRYSFDEPRASWDGYLIGKTIPRQPPMVAVTEDPPVVARIDAHIPVEESPPQPAVNHVDESVPGGSAQTRDYYSGSSSGRRKSFERSNSLRKTAASVVAEIEEMKAVPNPKVSPTNAEYAGGPTKLVVGGDGELRDLNLNSNSVREYCSGPFDASFRDTASSVVGNGVNNCSIKKSRRWIKAFNIWGLIHWRTGNKDDHDDRFSRVNGVERSYSESWEDMRGGKFNGEELGGFNRKVMRSNSSVSWRSSYQMDPAFGSARKIGVEMNGHGHGHSKKKNEFMLERNQSSRFSPNQSSNNRSLFKFYLPPMRGSRRDGFGNAKPYNAHSFSRSGSRVY